jgi:hypothetical protein
MNLDESIARIQQIIDELKVNGITKDNLEPISEALSLYEAAFEALKRFGRPAKVKDLLPEMRKLTKRARLSPQIAYQGLEYNRKHKKRVNRKDGLWTPKGH